MTAPGEGSTTNDPRRLPSCRESCHFEQARKTRRSRFENRACSRHTFSSAFPRSVASARCSDSGRTRPNHFRLGQDMSDRLLPPLLHRTLLHPRFSVPRVLGRRYVATEVDTRKTDRPHGDRAVHAADLRSVLRLGAIYDPLRHVRLVSTGLFTLVARLRDEPLTSLSFREPISPPFQVGRFELAKPEDRFFCAFREDDAKGGDPGCLPSQLDRGLAAGRPVASFEERERVFRRPGSPVGHTLGRMQAVDPLERRSIVAALPPERRSRASRSLGTCRLHLRATVTGRASLRPRSPGTP